MKLYHIGCGTSAAISRQLPAIRRKNIKCELLIAGGESVIGGSLSTT